MRNKTFTLKENLPYSGKAIVVLVAILDSKERDSLTLVTKPVKDVEGGSLPKNLIYIPLNSLRRNGKEFKRMVQNVDKKNEDITKLIGCYFYAFSKDGVFHDLMGLVREGDTILRSTKLAEPFMVRAGSVRSFNTDDDIYVYRGSYSVGELRECDVEIMNNNGETRRRTDEELYEEISFLIETNNEEGDENI